MAQQMLADNIRSYGVALTITTHSQQEYKEQVWQQRACEKKCVCFPARDTYNVETRQSVNQSRHVTANCVTLTQLSILIATCIADNSLSKVNSESVIYNIYAI